jgi:hypothetical protein
VQDAELSECYRVCTSWLGWRRTIEKHSKRDVCSGGDLVDVLIESGVPSVVPGSLATKEICPRHPGMADEIPGGTTY